MQIKLSENFRAVFYAPFYAIQALGFYSSEGVDVELLSSPAPAAAASGLLDGTIDLLGRADAGDEDSRHRPQFAARLLLRGRRARSVLSGREGRSIKVSAGRSAAAQDRDRVGSAHALAVPSARPARARCRSSAARSRDRPDDGGQSSRRCAAISSMWCRCSSRTYRWPWQRARATSSMRPARADRRCIQRSLPRVTASTAIARRLQRWRGPPAVCKTGSPNIVRSNWRT